MDGGHAGRAVAAGAGLDGDAGEALAGGGQAGGGAYLQLGLVVGGEQQEGGVGVEHVAGAFDRALEQAVEVVGGRGADEDLEGVGARAALGAGRVSDAGPRSGVCRTARSSVADEQADRGGLAVGVADPEVGGVDGDHAAVGAADAVAALPAGELEGLGDAGAGAGGLRPGGEVGEGLADDLLGGVAEEVRRRPRSSAEMAPARSIWTTATRTRLVGEREQVGGAGTGPAERVPTGRSGRSSWNQTCLCGGGVLDAPAGGEGGAQQQAAAALAVGAAEVGGRGPGGGSRAPGSGRRPRRVRRRRCAGTGRRRRCPRGPRRW